MTEIIKPRRQRKMARDPETASNNCADASMGMSASADVESEAPRLTKANLVISLLDREEGASLVELCEATSWLPHTCRAFLTGLRKKGRVPDKAKREDGTTTYRLARIEVAA